MCLYCYLDFTRSFALLCVSPMTAFKTKDAGFATQLLLKHGAVPSIRGLHGSPEPQAVSNIIIRAVNRLKKNNN